MPTDIFDYSMTLGFTYDTNDNKSFLNPSIGKNNYHMFNFELPLPLSNSNFSAHLINKCQLTVRIYFRGNILPMKLPTFDWHSLKFVKNSNRQH